MVYIMPLRKIGYFFQKNRLPGATEADLSPYKSFGKIYGGLLLFILIIFYHIFSPKSRYMTKL
ncbi:MAG TPA: hypothetical protein DEQ68_05375 [Ruminococcaceae bacterium]|nr:hypothetical protein [Oscillospiraceae bacterium]